MRTGWPLQQAFATIVALAAASHAFAGDDRETPAPLPRIEPAIVEYRWTFVEPVWSVEPRNVDMRVVVPATRSKRIEYDTVDYTMERRWIGRMPEFSCKYADFALPNECRTTWRNVYADVSIPYVRRDHMDVDVPDWQWRDARTTVDVPQLEWRQRELVVSLPAVAVYSDPAPAVSPTVKEKP